jgi:hypothetical protein
MLCKGYVAADKERTLAKARSDCQHKKKGLGTASQSRQMIWLPLWDC